MCNSKHKATSEPKIHNSLDDYFKNLYGIKDPNAIFLKSFLVCVVMECSSYLPIVD